jgi:GyrI-like small molecule binding domain
MNQILKIVLISIGALFLVITLFLIYMGIFSSPKVTEQTTGPYTYVYQEFTGPYKDTGPIFTKVDNALRAQGIESTLGIGVYYDNPAQTPADKLRSDCGTIINKTDVLKAKKLENDLKLGQFPKTTRMVVKFPIKNMFSFFIGPMKAYPAMMKYTESKGYTGETCGYEIYDMENKIIYYQMDITKK